MAADRSEIIARIRALRLKAIDKASTDAEIEAAAALASRLLMKHEISESDLRERGVAGMVQGLAKVSKTTPRQLIQSWQAICALTQTKTWKTDAGFVFAGDAADVELACYLAELIVAAGERGASKLYHTELKGMQKDHVQNVMRGFRIGFGKRLSERLMELDAERRAPEAKATGTGLVVLKGQLVEAYVASLGLGLKATKARAGKVSGSGIAAGRGAADSVNLGRPVTSSGKGAARLN